VDARLRLFEVKEALIPSKTILGNGCDVEARRGGIVLKSRTYRDARWKLRPCFPVIGPLSYLRVEFRVLGLVSDESLYSLSCLVVIHILSSF
jgi:hypothetical protein